MATVNDVLELIEFAQLVADQLTMNDLSTASLVSRHWAATFNRHVGRHVLVRDFSLSEAQAAFDPNDNVVRSLAFEPTRPLKDDVMEIVLEGVKTVKNFSISVYPKAPVEQAIKTVNACRRLKEMVFSSQGSGKNQALLDLLVDTPQLLRLEIGNLDYWEHPLMADINTRCPNLETLILRNEACNPLVPYGEQTELPVFHNLTHLTFEDWHGIGARHVLRMCPNLRSLEVPPHVFHVNSIAPDLSENLCPDLFTLSLLCKDATDPLVRLAISSTAELGWKTVTLRHLRSTQAIVPSICRHWAQTLSRLTLFVNGPVRWSDINLMFGQLTLLEFLKVRAYNPRRHDIIIPLGTTENPLLDSAVWPIGDPPQWTCQQLRYLDLPLALPPMLPEPGAGPVYLRRVGQEIQRARVFERLLALPQLQTIYFHARVTELRLTERRGRVNAMLQGKAALQLWDPYSL